MDRREMLAAAAGLVVMPDFASFVKAMEAPEPPPGPVTGGYDFLIKAKAECEAKWASTGLLEGINDPHLSRELGTLMENQRLFNEIKTQEEEHWERTRTLDPNGLMPSDDELPENIRSAYRVRRVSIPLVRRVFVHPLLNRLAPMWSMLGPRVPTFFKEPDGMLVEGTDASPGVLKLRSIVEYQPKHGEMYKTAPKKALDMEAEVTAVLAMQFGDELCHKAMEAGWGLAKFGTTNLMSALEHLRRTHARSKFYAVIGEHDLIEHRWTGKIEDGEFLARFKRLKQVLPDTEVWVDMEMPEGHKGLAWARGQHPLAAGLLFCPYVPFAGTPVVKTQEGGERQGYLTRYGWAAHPKRAGEYFVTVAGRS